VVPSKPEQSTYAPNADPAHATNDVSADATVDVKPNETGESNGVTDKKTETDGVDLSHEELLAQQSGIIVFHIISGRLSKRVAWRFCWMMDIGHA